MSKDHLSELKKRPTLEDKIIYVADNIDVPLTSIEFSYMTIDSLLAAYLNIRENFVEISKERDSAWRDAIEKAKKDYENYFCISYEKLSTMTLKEIAELIN